MRILICPELCQKYINYAKYLLTLFVKNCEQVYSKSFAVYNIHNLLHIADDAERYGCLDNCSALYNNKVNKLNKTYAYILSNNSCCILNNGQHILINDQIYIECTLYMNVGQLFNIPCDSRKVKFL